jgi:hypothetical protein
MTPAMKVSALEPRRFMEFFLRRMVLAAVLLGCAIATGISAEPQEIRIRAPGAFDRAENLSCELRGPVRGYIDRIVANWLLKAPEQIPPCWRCSPIERKNQRAICCRGLANSPANISPHPLKSCA